MNNAGISHYYYLKTGGGHLAPARSVANYLAKAHPETPAPVLVDGFENAPKILRDLVVGGYQRAQNHLAWVFEATYALNKFIPLTRLTAHIISYLVKVSLRERIGRDKPSTIVIFHFMLIRPILELLREQNLSTRVIVVVTDPFSAHPFWFLKKEPEFVVFSEQVEATALRRGIAKDRLHIFPFVLDAAYSTPRPENELPALKEKYGFKADGRVILMLGGGDGLPKGRALLRWIVRFRPAAGIAFVCGGNSALQRRAEKIRARYGLTQMQVYGFVDFVPDLIGISDVVVSKAGASSVMQILLLQRVPVIIRYLWEQEKGNVDYICRNHLGIYEHSTRRLFRKMEALLSDPGLYGDYLRNVKQAGLRNGLEEVAQFLCGA